MTKRRKDNEDYVWMGDHHFNGKVTGIEIESGVVKSITGDGVGGTPENPVLSYPAPEDIGAIATGNVLPSDLGISTDLHVPRSISNGTAWSTVRTSSAVSPGTLVQRTTGDNPGRIKAADPIDSDDAVNLQTMLSAISSVYTYKGSVADEASLPSTGNTIGDVWNTEDTGMSFAWTGTEWETLGTTVDLSGYATKAEVTEVKESLDSKLSIITNDEFIYAIVTADNVLLWGKRHDGTTYDCDVTLPDELAVLEQKISFYESTFNKVDTPEYLSITVDNEDRIIEAILRDGTKFLQALKTNKVETESLKLSDDGMSQLQKDLKEAGFTSGTGDWSDEENLRLPIPRVPAKINLIIPRLPVTKTEDIEGEMEYYDIDGNFFKKKIVINAQGNSSMAYTKKNFSFDLDDGSEIKFGDWVVQDSWHLKAHYTDALKSNNNVAYDLFETLARNHRPYDMSRVWDTEFKQGQTTTSGVGNFIEDHDTGARGFPDGFPTTVYHNGEFHGIYMFNLKKHRDNYKMDRGNENHIHLDGDIGPEEMFNGVIDWTKFEIRNPKPRQNREGWELLTLSGDKYDGDNPTELGNTGKTLDVKLAIQRLAESVNALRDTPTKQVFESYFSNTWMFADYMIMVNLVANGDAYRKNWQWVTYNGGDTWTIAPYDWDVGVGLDHIGNVANAPSSDHIVGGETPIHYFWLIYQDEVKARYQELKESGFLTAENIFSFYKKYTDWIGAENFEKELKKWPEIPSYRESGLNDNWSLKSRTITTDPINYDPDVDYLAGDEVVYGLDSERYVFVNKSGSKGEPPLDLFYADYPRTLGFYNSVTRIYLWLKERINKLDTIYQID